MIYIYVDNIDMNNKISIFDNHMYIFLREIFRYNKKCVNMTNSQRYELYKIFIKNLYQSLIYTCKLCNSSKCFDYDVFLLKEEDMYKNGQIFIDFDVVSDVNNIVSMFVILFKYKINDNYIYLISDILNNKFFYKDNITSVKKIDVKNTHIRINKEIYSNVIYLIYKIFYPKYHFKYISNIDDKYLHLANIIDRI